MMSQDNIILEMVKAYLGTIFPGRSLESLKAVRRDTCVDEAMASLYAGRSPWGKAEKAAYARMRVLRWPERRRQAQ